MDTLPRYTETFKGKALRAGVDCHRCAMGLQTPGYPTEPQTLHLALGKRTTLQRRALSLYVHMIPRTDFSHNVQRSVIVTMHIRMP